MPISRPKLAVVCAAATLALVAGACGDDDESSGDAAGDPIKVAHWTATDNPQQSTPQVRTGVEARVKAINDEGGINGRPIELSFCDTEFDPNTEAGCARSAVENGVVAVVGSTSFFPNTLPLLERAGIAHVGSFGHTPAEFTNPISFPIGSGVPGWFYGAVDTVVQRGAQNIALVSSTNSASEFAVELMTEALRLHGKEPLKTVIAPIGQPDQATAATDAAAGSDAVIIAATADVTTSVVQFLRQSNYPGIIAGVSATFTDDIIRTLGTDVVEGLVLSSQTIPDSQTDHPGIARFLREMDAVDPGAGKDERSLMAWAAADFLGKLLERIDGEITAATVLDAVRDVDEPIDVEVMAPYTSTTESPLPELPQLHAPHVVFTELRDGIVVPVGDGEFVNPFEVAGR